MATHGGDRLDRLFHLHVDDADDALRRFGDIQAERLGNRGLDRGARLWGTAPPSPAQEVIFAEIAKHQIAVGDGRRLATAPVASRSRHCTRALWSDLEHAEPVD